MYQINGKYMCLCYNQNGGYEMNVLILDDEKEIVDLLEVYLKNENYNVYKFYTSEDAIKCIDTVHLDIAIFNVIMLTSKIEDNDKIKGLTLRGRRLYN